MKLSLMMVAKIKGKVAIVIVRRAIRVLITNLRTVSNDLRME
jgi:hypothetical protein